MEDFAYLSYDAKTTKTILTSDFIAAINKAFADMYGFRAGYLRATDAVLAAQKSYDDAKAEATASGLIGKNAEERAANLDLTLRPLHDHLIDNKKAQRIAEHDLQIGSDNVRELQMILEAVKVGVVQTHPTQAEIDPIY